MFFIHQVHQVALPGDNEETFWSSSQADTRPQVQHTVDAPDCAFHSLLNVKQISCGFRSLLVNPTRNRTLTSVANAVFTQPLIGYAINSPAEHSKKQYSNSPALF